MARPPFTRPSSRRRLSICCRFSSSTAPTDYGEAPFYASEFNKIWYDPAISYAPGVDSAGTSLGNATPTNASDDAYLSGTRRNLASAFREVDERQSRPLLQVAVALVGVLAVRHGRQVQDHVGGLVGLAQ